MENSRDGISIQDASFCHTHSIWLNNIIHAIKLKAARNNIQGLKQKPIKEFVAAVLNSQLNTPFKLQNNVFVLPQYYTDKEFIEHIMLSKVKA